MSIFQSFQTGLAIGQEQRKQRDVEFARKGAADAFKAGNFEGASTGLMAAGLYDEADAYTRAGDRSKAEKRRKDYGEAFKSSGWTGLGEMAAGEADFETAGYASGQARTQTLQDWEDHDRKIMEHKQGVEFLATSAGQLRGLPMEARGQAAMDIIARSPFADNPQVMEAVQRAAADGRITDEELTQFEEQMLTYAQRLEGERWGKQFDETVRMNDHSIYAFNASRQDRKEEQKNGAGEFGLTPIYGRDADGNRVLIQTNKQGGVRQADIPEGVTLEDDFYKSTASTLGKGQGDLILQKSKREAGLEAVKSDFLNLEQTIDKAIKQTNPSNTGFLGQANPFAVNLQGTLKTIKANAAFTTLQEMRNNSPTGGALGQVSERELDLLMAAAAALERSQNQGQLDANLAAFKEKLRGSMMRLERAFEQDYNSGLFGNMNVESARAATFGGSGQGPAQQGGASDLSAMSDDDLKAALGIR
jgi:hypothetical protein